MGRLSTNLRQIIGAYQLFTPGEVVLVAVSGGADSVALLHMLNQLKPMLGINLHVATLDHSLRDDSADDAQFVVSFATKLGLPVSIKRTDVTKVAQEMGVGIEFAGRHVRYEFFGDVAIAIGSESVVTAHHLDDQAETVLMHLLRGSGLRGAGGMQIKSNLPGSSGINLFRPLLWVSHASLVAYCEENNLRYREDPTNRSSDWVRNRIRNEVLPLLTESFNPQVSMALARFADVNRSDDSFLQEVVREVISPHIHLSETDIRIARQPFQTWHPAVQRRSIIHALKAHSPEIEAEYVHLIHAIKLGISGRIGSIAEFPGGVRMRVDYGELVIEQGEVLNSADARQILLPEPELQLELSAGRNEIPGCTWILWVGRGSPQKLQDKGTSLHLRIGASERMILRGRKPGDRFYASGLKGHSKKLSDWMIDLKIPRHLRDRVPLLVIGEKIAAVMWDRRWFLSFVHHNNNVESIVEVQISTE